MTGNGPQNATQRPNWGEMRRQDFDDRVPLTLFDEPPPPIDARTDDLLFLLDQEDETR